MKMRQDIYVKQHCESKGDLDKQNKTKNVVSIMRRKLPPYLAAHPNIEMLFWRTWCGSLLNLCGFSPYLLIALCDFPFPLIPLLFSQWWGQRVLSSPLVPAGVTNGNEALPAACGTSSKQSESAGRKWKSVIRNSNEEHEWRGASHKGQPPKVRTCAGQSLVEACVTIFDCEQSIGQNCFNIRFKEHYRA